MIFYFTGTGNSLYVAKQLDTERMSIPHCSKRKPLLFAAEQIGIVCPIYGHEMPGMVKEFLHKASFHTDYLYLVLTYGARHANAVELADQVLHAANKQAAYITTLRMVDNFLPAFDMDRQRAMDKQVDCQLAEIKADLLAKKQLRQQVSPQDREVHRGYLHMVNGEPETVWAKFTVTKECIGCGICMKVCPAGCIQLDNQRAVLHTGPGCQACYACIHACSKLAIQLTIPEKNCKARYRNPQISLCELVAANNQWEN